MYIYIYIYVSKYMLCISVVFHLCHIRKHLIPYIYIYIYISFSIYIYAYLLFNFIFLRFMLYLYVFARTSEQEVSHHLSAG